MYKCKKKYEYDPHCHNCGICLRNALIKHMRVGKYSCGNNSCKIITDYDLEMMRK